MLDKFSKFNWLRAAAHVTKSQLQNAQLSQIVCCNADIITF